MSKRIKNEKAKEKLAYLREQIFEKGRKLSDEVEGIKYTECLEMTDKHDYYQVESLEHAMILNPLAGGYLNEYHGPHFGTYKVC